MTERTLSSRALPSNRSLILILIICIITVGITFVINSSPATFLNGSLTSSYYQDITTHGLDKTVTHGPDEMVTQGLDARYLNDPQFREIATHGPGEECIKRLPNAIVVGVQKGGTTALLSFLSAHPNIVACMHPAETQYFSAHQGRPLDWYKHLMPCSYSNQITMEKSPPYFYRGWTARLIRRRLGENIKIIVIVKDPIVRAESMFAMAVAHRKSIQENGLKFEDFVIKNGTVQKRCKFIQFSEYPKHMTAWLDTFKRSNILIVDGHNLERNPAEELNIVETFLGVGSYYTEDRFFFNETKEKYCLRRDDGTPNCLDDRKGRTHPEYSEEVRTLLQDFFRPQNERFFKMINRRFDWGY